MTKEDLEVLHERLSKLDDDKENYLAKFNDIETITTLQTGLLKQALDRLEDTLRVFEGLQERVIMLESGEVNNE